MKGYATDAIRNVALVGHGGAGKTSLAEALLYVSGAIERQGRVEDGTTVCDFDAEEIRRKATVHLALAPCEWNGVKINVLDAPGYPDFLGEVAAAARERRQNPLPRSQAPLGNAPVCEALLRVVGFARVAKLTGRGGASQAKAPFPSGAWERGQTVARSAVDAGKRTP